MLSYRDSIDVGIAADRRQVPDPWPLADGIRRAVTDLESAVPQGDQP